MSTLVIDGGTVITMDAGRTVLDTGRVVVQNGEIVSVTPENSPVDLPGADVILAQGKLVLPGFVNGHTHVSEILLRGGPGSDRSLYDWQWNVVYPSMQYYGERDIAVAALLYSVDALRSGTTTIIDNANSATTPPRAQAALDVYAQVGVRAVLAPVFACGPLPDYRLLDFARDASPLDPRSMLVRLDDVGDLLDGLMSTYNKAGNPRLCVWPAPHKPNRTSLASIQLSHDLVERYGGMVSQPCAEVLAERMVGSLTSVEHLRRHGLLNPRTLLGHCVWVSKEDIDAISAAGARLAHLPVANLYLGSGVAPVPRMLKAGVTVGLGTDNANCNNSVSVLREASIAALVHKGVTGDPAAITADTVLAMATIDGARAAGLARLIGSIEVGKRADLVLLDAIRPNMVPNHDPVSTVIYQATGAEVDTVIVDGDVLMREGVLTGFPPHFEEELREEAQRRSVDILRRGGLFS